jgi:glycosyltransferase involved in cell wall biosynthesis
MTKIIAALRIRNEGRWITACLESLKPLCSTIIVMDDGSTDDTRERCARAGAEVWPSPFAGLDEHRDKNWLLSKVAPHKPDWVFLVDGDEALDSDGPDQIRESITKGGADHLMFQVMYLWNRVDTVRQDGVYARFWTPRLYRWGANIGFTPTNYAKHNLHCMVDQEYRRVGRMCPAKLWHLGYLFAEDRVKKYTWQNGVDPNNSSEGYYMHMAQGDLPEIPADATLTHAGPLRLESVTQ